MPSHRKTAQQGREQEIAETSNRLIKNAIICWNYLYPAHTLETMDNQKYKDKLLYLRFHYIHHVVGTPSLCGEYDLSDKKSKIQSESDSQKLPLNLE